MKVCIKVKSSNARRYLLKSGWVHLHGVSWKCPRTGKVHQFTDRALDAALGQHIADTVIGKVPS